MWKCSVRSKALTCPATVLQRGEDEFVTGNCDHVHAADPKLPYKVKVSAEAKRIASTNLFRPAMAIVEDVIMQVVPQEERFLAPKMELLKRSSNLHRSKVRPTEPRDIDFELNLEYISAEDFLVKDVNEEGCRHLILATKYQLQLLSQTRCWYMDGTFKVVPDFLKPRGQLLSIHGFVRRDGREQQFPLALVLMSSRREEDYVKVFEGILSALPAPPAVDTFMIDFEQGAWKAIQRTFPDVAIQGCCFHWTQAIWRRIQDLGLAPTYMKREATHRYIKQLMALPFLPPDDIPPAFHTLTARANTAELRSLVDYMDRQWIQNPLFPSSAWSVYRLPVRTNNDVEGWHHRNEKLDIVVAACMSFAPSFFKRQELWRLESIVTTSAGMSGEAQRRYSRNWKPHGTSTTVERSARATSCVSVEQCMLSDPVTGCLLIEVS